jgi:chaperonin cofactor prefoldin
MEIEKFEQAKKIKENLDKLERQKYKLESALKSCGLEATIEFARPGGFIRKEEVSFKGNDIIKEMVTKELERVIEEIELVKEEFENI